MMWGKKNPNLPCFCVCMFVFVINYSCHAKSTSQSEEHKQDVTGTDREGKNGSPLPRGLRAPPYITSEGTHFLNVAHHGGVNGGDSVEAWFILHLQSAVRG